MVDRVGKKCAVSASFVKLRSSRLEEDKMVPISSVDKEFILWKTTL